jgi:hypothetical protein
MSGGLARMLVVGHVPPPAMGTLSGFNEWSSTNLSI